MKRLACIIILAAAAFAPLCAAYGVGASQEWVRDYVRTNAAGASSLASGAYSVVDGVATISVTNAAGTVATLTAEIADSAAVCATNCTDAATALGVTNGTLFAWIGEGVYTNAALGEAVTCTATNLVFRGVGSAADADGLDHVEGWCDLFGTRVTNTQREALTEGGL